jgi:uncharacterized membrane protein YhaH (DUF805 family)
MPRCFLTGARFFRRSWASSSCFPSIAVLVRRLHDTDRSGWWYWISFVPLIGTIVLFVFAVQRGTPGQNSYG